MEAWLSRITTNAFLDEVRRKKRRPLEVVPDLPERVTGVDLEPLDVLDTSRLPEHIQEALKSLPIEFRSAVVLCDVVGLNYQEIAESLDVPVGTVRSRIHRGRAQLRVMLG
jgi:RNA polymerase sigma-70 factor (ECF subfamily)